MRENVGRIERIARSIIGPGLAALGISQLSDRPVLGVLGLVTGTIVLESAVTRVCPLNGAFGRDTRSQDERLRDSRVELAAETARAIQSAGVAAVMNADRIA
jgi:hypothetical protein